jgi:hypothetical protein
MTKEKSELGLGEKSRREDEGTCSIYTNVEIDQAIPHMVPIEDQNGVENKENECLT